MPRHANEWDQNGRTRAAIARNPRRCDCQGGYAGPSTHRASSHFSRCQHSTLQHDTRPAGLRPRLRPVRGTRRWVIIEEG